MAQLGISERKIKKWIAEALGVGQKETDRILSDEVYTEYNQHARAYRLSGLKQTPFAENTELQSLIQAVTQQTHGTFQNLTQSLGFATKGPLGKVNVQRLQEFYTKTLDDAMMDIVSGAFSYNAEQVAAELSTDYFEVSAHGGARPSHAEWQRRVYSRAELYSVCGLDTATGLLGINCYHSYDPFIPGISVRRYSDDDLDRIRKEDARLREYGGKTYNKYEALQHQRKLETTLRKYRRDVHLLEKGGADPDTILNKKIKYQVTYGQYKHFSKAMELPMQRARIYQDGLDVNMYVKRVAKPMNHDTINHKTSQIFNLHFEEFGNSKGYEDLVKSARTELSKYYQVTGLHSDGHIFGQRDSNGKIVRKYTPELIAESIKSDPKFDGKAVKIYSCDAGSKDADAAQRLANALGVPVKAPIDNLALMENGKFVVFSELDLDGRILKKYKGEEGDRVQ